MFTLQVLNDSNEWELIAYTFKTEEEAVAFFNAELDCFADYIVTEMQTA